MLIKDNQTYDLVIFRGVWDPSDPCTDCDLSIAFLQEDDLYDMKWSPQITVYDQIIS